MSCHIRGSLKFPNSQVCLRYKLGLLVISYIFGIKQFFFQRSLKLFAIGLILNTVGGHNQLEKLRIPGVLQRFAVSYFFTSTVYLLCGPAPGKDPMVVVHVPFISFIFFYHETRELRQD